MLRKWLKGEVGIKEERQLEQLAKEDAFLAEALEGYRSMPENNHLKTTTQLKAKLRNRAQKRRGALGYYRAAAAVVLLITASLGFWYLNQSEPQTTDIAAVEKKETEESLAAIEADMEEQDIAPPEPEEEIAEESNANTENNQTENKIALRQVAPKTSVLKKEIQPRNKAKSDLPANQTPVDQIALAEEVEEEDTEELPSKEYAEPIAKNRSQAEGFTSSPAQPVKTITGTIKDDSGEPLIGANVLVPGTQQGTVTNLEGKFQLQLDSMTNQLDISYTGYSSKTIDINNQNKIDVVLDAGEVLDEVVITGSAKRRSEKNISTISTNAPAQPKGGLRKLARHIRKNLQYPKMAKDNRIEGAVSLSFNINKDGKPENILVTQSLGYGCDEEAIRLLKTGPEWKPVGGRGNFRIPFILKK